MSAAHRYTDAEIFSAVRKALDDDPAVPQEVRVHVEHGTVTLTAGVLWAHEKSNADDVVRHVDGVSQI